MTTKKNDHKLKLLLIFKQIPPGQHVRKCIENSMENMHTDVKVYMIEAAVLRALNLKS